MNQIDIKLKAMAKQEDFSLPKDAEARIANTLESLPELKSKERSFRCRKYRRPTAAAFAAALALFLILPNISPSIAYAMQSLPVIGKMVRVVTIRDYKYEDSHHSANAAIPKVEVEDDNLQHSADLINGDVEVLTNALLQRFKQDVEASGSQSYSSLDISYEVVTNTDSWFTLKLTVFEAAGSSNTYYKYYHIDKAAGSIVALKDLFKENSSYAEAISQSIKEQMKQRMEEDDSTIYWLDSEFPEFDFTSIDETHNFYFAEDGNIVIAFDKYEVAPGSMGCPKFEIRKEVYQKYLK